MYRLLTGLYAQYTEKEQFFVLILGLDNAGKTTLLDKIKQIYSHSQPGVINPTVGLNLGKVDVKRARINFWDLGGQSSLRSIWDKYYDDCHAIMFVVDSTDRDRIEDVKSTLGTYSYRLISWCRSDSAPCETIVTMIVFSLWLSSILPKEIGSKIY